ncbi:MAG: universal stress protein [Gammaproteobacteria bacterium]|nr:universal stress protein [Gammaproteobacteria bacterium]
MQIIFVPVADRPECAVALRTAFEVGARLNASVNGCHIRPHRGSDVSLPEEFGSLDAAWESALASKKTKSSGTAAEALFAKVAKRNDYTLVKKPTTKPGAVWLEKVGSPDRVLSIMGPVSDLLIVSRPAKKGGKLATMFMVSALLNSSRPVLILPQGNEKPVGRRISIAWNQSHEAAKAVAAALPLLQVAEEVNIITSGNETALGPKAAQLATYLRAWGVKSKRVRASGPDHAKAILKSFHDTRSDLLVMGAYSRSRLRQRIFGGVTDFILNRSNIPVLMLHS